MLLAPEAGEVSAAVRGWLTGQGYGAVTDGAAPERLSGGVDFWVYGLRFAGPGLPPRWSAPLVPGKWLSLARHLAESGDAGEFAASLRTMDVVRDQLEVADPVVCHGDFHPGNVLVAPGGSVLHVIDWTNVGVGDRHGDIAWTLLWFEIAAVAAPRRASRVLMRVLRRRLQRAYLTGYRRVLPVDGERVRLWRPVSLLRIWSAAEASQRGLMGSEPRLPAGLIGWAAREFRRALPGAG